MENKKPIQKKILHTGKTIGKVKLGFITFIHNLVVSKLLQTNVESLYTFNIHHH